jgi:hypothetical protein
MGRPEPFPDGSGKKRQFMKTMNFSKSMLLGAALLLTTSAFAANTGSFEVMDAVTVNGQSLKPGDYNLKWDGTGTSVQLRILKGKKVVATTPAQMVTLQRSASNSAAVLKSNPDGSKSLSEIRFDGKKFALTIGEDTTQPEANSSTK